MTDVPFASDFLPIYAQSLAVCNGAPLYDVASQNQILLERYGFSLPSQMLFPPPYPPWVAIINSPLCMFTPQNGAVAFLIWNLTLYALALLVLTADQRFAPRAVLLTIAASFPPMIGLVIVGQLTMPVLLGAALIAYSLPKRQCLTLALGIALLSFKPLIGSLLLACLSGFYLIRRERWILGVLKPLVILFSGLLAVSFIIEPRWPLTFFEAAVGMSRSSINLMCDTCSSSTIALMRALQVTPAILSQWSSGLIIGSLFIAIGLGAAVSSFSKSVVHVVGISVLVTLILPTYVRNYDYVLLIVPLIIALGAKTSKLSKLIGLSTLALVWWIALSSREIQGQWLWITAVVLLMAFLIPARASGVEIKSRT